MNIEEFKCKVDSMFPCKWENDYLKDMQTILDNYIEVVSCLDGIQNIVLSEIKELCTNILEVINLYYDGRRGEAFILFSSILNGSNGVAGLFSSIGNINIKETDLYFRARERKNGVEFSILDMFHIPLNKRGIVSTQRYSSPGYPCLYLGNSVYSCWEELRRPLFDTLMFSAYKVRYSFRVFDMRIPDISEYSNQMLEQTIKRIPLVLACSVSVKNSEDVFKPEYIIPQMLVETIICNNRKITQEQKSPIDVIWGIIYTSTHINNDFPYGRRFMENIVLPIIDTKNPANYCSHLASLFEISCPLCHEFESLKENTSRMFMINVGMNKSDEETIRERYEQSKMGYLEDKLREAHFETLPYLVIGCPENGIVLDHLGNPVTMEIRSSVPYTIE